jgi:hypothetical protein
MVDLVVRPFGCIVRSYVSLVVRSFGCTVHVLRCLIARLCFVRTEEYNGRQPSAQMFDCQALFCAD